MGLNICVDIDGTITDAYYWLQYANKHFNKNLQPKDVTKYDIHEVFNISREDYQLFYEKYGRELHASAELRENAGAILSKLASQHKIYYVTARESIMEDVTKEWFNKNQLPSGELFMLGTHYKVDQAKKLNCNLFIEDRYENAIQLAASGIKVLLIDCNYNRQPLTKGITRVYCWQDIDTIVQELSLEILNAKAKIA